MATNVNLGCSAVIFTVANFNPAFSPHGTAENRSRDEIHEIFWKNSHFIRNSVFFVSGILLGRQFKLISRSQLMIDETHSRRESVGHLSFSLRISVLLALNCE